MGNRFHHWMRHPPASSSSRRHFPSWTTFGGQWGSSGVSEYLDRGNDQDNAQPELERTIVRQRGRPISPDLYRRLEAHFNRSKAAALAPRRAYQVALRRATLAVGGAATGSHPTAGRRRSKRKARGKGSPQRRPDDEEGSTACGPGYR